MKWRGGGLGGDDVVGSKDDNPQFCLSLSLELSIYIYPSFFLSVYLYIGSSLMDSSLQLGEQSVQWKCASVFSVIVQFLPK